MPFVRLIIIASLLLTTGCGGFNFLNGLDFDFFISGFLHPGYTDQHLVDNDLLEGEWTEEGQKRTHCTMKHHGDGKYEILFWEEDNGEQKKLMPLSAQLFDLNGTLVLDALYTLDKDLVPEGAWLFFMPIRQFFVVKPNGDHINLSMLNSIELGERLDKHPDVITHEKEGSFVMITAKTEEIRSFLTEAIKDEDMLTELVLVAAPTEQ